MLGESRWRIPADSRRSSRAEDGIGDVDISRRRVDHELLALVEVVERLDRFLLRRDQYHVAPPPLGPPPWDGSRARRSRS